MYVSGGSIVVCGSNVDRRHYLEMCTLLWSVSDQIRDDVGVFIEFDVIQSFANFKLKLDLSKQNDG